MVGVAFFNRGCINVARELKPNIFEINLLILLFFKVGVELVKKTFDCLWVFLTNRPKRQHAINWLV